MSDFTWLLVSSLLICTYALMIPRDTMSKNLLTNIAPRLSSFMSIQSDTKRYDTAPVEEGLQEFFKDDPDEENDYLYALEQFKQDYIHQNPQSEPVDETTLPPEEQTFRRRLRQKYGLEPNDFVQYQRDLDSDPGYLPALREFKTQYLRDLEKKEALQSDIHVTYKMDLLRIRFNWTESEPDQIVLEYSKREAKSLYRNLLKRQHPVCTHFIPEQHTPSYSFKIFVAGGYQIGGTFHPRKSSNHDAIENVILDVSKKWSKVRNVQNLKRGELGTSGIFKKNRVVRVLGWVRTCLRKKLVLDSNVFLPNAPRQKP